MEAHFLLSCVDVRPQLKLWVGRDRLRACLSRALTHLCFEYGQTHGPSWGATGRKEAVASNNKAVARCWADLKLAPSLSHTELSQTCCKTAWIEGQLADRNDADDVDASDVCGFSLPVSSPVSWLPHFALPMVDGC